jgi:hypothetical protein
VPLLSDVFNFAESANIYLPKEQYNPSIMLIPSLNLLGMVYNKVQF